MMRIIKKHGRFQIDDTPMRLTGKAARDFRAKLDNSVSSNPNHERVLAEIREIVKKKK